jgi:hypothetical protein
MPQGGLKKPQATPVVSLSKPAPEAGPPPPNIEEKEKAE